MHEQHPTRRRRDSILPGDGGDRAPSAAAQARLSEALRGRAQSYRQDASVDLTMLEALLRLDHPEAAAKALDDHRASLAAMAQDLQIAVAHAAVEREAELVCSAVDQTAAPRPLAGNVRRRVLAVTGAAAVVLALVLPTARYSPRTTLTSVAGGSDYDDLAAARERLEAARSWARALRTDTIVSQRSEARTAAPSPVADAVVRSTLRPILAADDPGGSAAQTLASDATVTDLESYRAAKESGGSSDPAPRQVEPDPEPPAEPEPPAPPIGLPDVGADPSGKNIPVSLDPGIVTGPVSEADLPADVDVDAAPAPDRDGGS